ncbi:MAG: hypothetical protein ACKVQJ_12315 [Pyrinomonadaceae bacterium]
MNALTGMEKFSHLEDKIYLTIEFAKKMRDEKEKFENEAVSLRRETANAIADKKALEEKLAGLLSERDSIQLKVEAMLDAMTMIDSDVAELLDVRVA